MKQVRSKNKNRGYAIVVVLVLLVIGTVTLVMLNRENLFFTRVVGFFSRTKKIQSQAQSGIDLARADISAIASNSRRQSTSGLNTFRSLVTGGAGAAFDQGLYFDSGSSRNLTPRISRTDGDLQLRVFYFPEDPCVDLACSTADDYNKRLPKRFVIVSEAMNTKSGDIFTIESRIQVKLENLSEVSFGVHGRSTYPPAGTQLEFSPALYGRSHFGLDADDILFIFTNTDMEKRSGQHVFDDLATFSGENTSDGYPFHVLEHQLQQQQPNGMPAPVPGKLKKPMMNFKKGYQGNTDVLPTAGDTDYDPNYDPASDTFFNQLQAKAESSGGGVNLASSLPSGSGTVDVCLKMMGTVIKRYNCNYIDSTNKIMGRIDMNVHPDFRTALNNHHTHANGENTSAAQRFSNLVDGSGQSVVTRLMSETDPHTGNFLYDRYNGEHADVYNNNTNNAVAGGDISANGIIFCRPNDGRICNVHIKGILDGQVTIAADKVTIEGDIQYQNQDRNSSDDMFGVIAKQDIIIPPGVPQAATSQTPYDTYWQNPRQTQSADNATPIGDGTPGGMPSTLAESYLGITNFIPYNSGQYTDRDEDNVDYMEYANWIPLGDLGTNDKMYYNSPMALDLDGNFFAGNVIKVDGIFNPEDIGSTTRGIGVLTCEGGGSGSGIGCNNYKYRDLLLSDNSANALYADSSRTTLATGSDGQPVKPLFWFDGLDPGSMVVGGCTGDFPGSCDSNPTGKANYLNVGYQTGEEIARPSSPLLHVFGSINSKFFLIYGKYGAQYGGKISMGFKNKIISPDPRTASLYPPGFPSGILVKVEELYQKFHTGKSPLITN